MAQRSKSMKAWANDAYNLVQDACNLSGIVFALDQLIVDLKDANELRNDHPFLVLWIDKLDDLSRSRSFVALPCDQPIDELVDELVVVMRRLCDDKTIRGTDERNQHTDAQAVIRKMVSATGTRNIFVFGEAYHTAKGIADGHMSAVT